MRRLIPFKGAVKRPLCLICTILIIIIYLYKGDVGPAPRWNVDSLDGKTIIVEGEVCGKQNKDELFKIYLRSADIYIEKDAKENKITRDIKIGLVVNLTDNQYASMHIKLGQHIKVKGVFSPFSKAFNEGGFDARKYYCIRGYDGQVKRARIIGISERYNHITEYLSGVRECSIDIIKSKLDVEDAGIMAAMLLGDKSNLSSDIKELYQTAGISHLLALSGLHIAATGLFISKMLRKTGLRKMSAEIIAGVIIIIYAVMTGLAISTVRAAIMFVLAIISTCIKRSYDLLSAAAFSCLVVLIMNTNYLYDVGFLLSYGAIVGIGYVYPVLDKLFNPRNYIRGIYAETKLRNRLRTIVDRIVQSVGISLSITLATLPITTYSFFQISSYSILLNLIVIPLMSLVLFFGFTGIITGAIACTTTGIIYLICECSLSGSMKISEYILYVYKILCGITTQINGNILLFGRPEKWQWILYGIILCVTLAIANTMIKSCGSINGCAAGFIIPGAVAISIISACLVLVQHNRAELEIRNLFVGQGDCSLIWGENTPVIMIDGGSTDVKNVAKYNIVPALKSNRINKVDYCFLTHMDEDHISGIMEILESPELGITIRNIIIPTPVTSIGVMDNKLNLLMSAQKGGNINLLTMNAGNKIALGDINVTCYSPSLQGEYIGNDSSLVLEIDKYDNEKHALYKGLFMGDASEKVEKLIANDLGKVHYLKVGHHGSKYSTSQELLTDTNPDVAVISYGINNTYGHPHSETINRLEKNGANIEKTAESGEIITILEKGKLRIKRTLTE